MRAVAVILATLAALPPPPPPDPPAPPAPPAPPPPEIVLLEGERFELELALDEKARARGLGGRERLEPGKGMLFVFPDARRRVFWMKDCLIDIDLLFLDPRGRIVRTHEMTREPPRREDETEVAYERRLKRYWSRLPAQFVIEIPAGSIKRLDIKAGRVVEMDLEKLKRLCRESGPRARTK